MTYFFEKTKFLNIYYNCEGGYCNMTDINNTKKIVALYCRVSTIEQAEEGYSIGEQERILIEYCNQHNYTVYRTYADKGISGKDIEHRPAIQELLYDASEKKFNMVISWKINRMSRKLSDAIKIVETLEKYGITYRSYSEPFETDTPAGRMQFQMMALIGEFERSTIAQNVKMGMCAKAKQGEWCGGVAPLGYKWISMEKNEKSSRKKSKLEIDETEAETVRLIYELYASGKGYKAIVNQINKMGYKTKLGNAFSVAQLKTILTNPVYIGKVRFNVRQDWNEKRRHNINPNPIIVEGIHDAIIDDDLWHRVQSIMSEKSGKPSRIYDGEYPLTGILRCPECGAGMVISRTTNTLKDGTKKRIAYYACGEWKNKGTAVCHSNSIRVEKANAVVYKELEKLFSNEKFLRAVVKKVNEEREHQLKTAKTELKKFEKELVLLERKKNKLFNAYEEGVITSSEFLERKKFLTEETEMLQEKKEQAITLITLDKKKEIPYEVVKEILQNFSKVLNDEEIERGLKKQLLHMVISEITLDKRREIDTINLKITDELLQFLQDKDGTSINGVPSKFLLSQLGIPVLDLKLAI